MAFLRVPRFYAGAIPAAERERRVEIAPTFGSNQKLRRLKREVSA